MYDMNLKRILSISGLPGLYLQINTKGSGAVVEGLDDGKRKFVPQRRHQFTPIQVIQIFTEGAEESVLLSKVFQNMRDQQEDNPPPTGKVDNDTIKEYFEDVLPTYDRQKVYVSDMKKIIKWYDELNRNGYIDAEPEEQEEPSEEDTTNTDEQ